jgi:hypothetical protein
VLRGVGVHRQLVDELLVPPRQGVGSQFAVELPAFGRRVVAASWGSLRPRQVYTTPGTIAIQLCDQKANPLSSGDPGARP